MRRTRKSAASGRKSQSVKSAEQLVKQAKKRARELLKKANTDVRAVRHDVAALKKVGIVSSRVDARRYLPTKYMMKKIAANRDVLSGDVIAVRASPKIRKKYVEKGVYEQRGSTLIVPREYANQRTKISRGLVEISRDLKMGEEIRLILPFKATDMEALAHKLMADPTLDGMKKNNELFGFRLFGHNMNTIGFPSHEELAAYILTHYSHLFSGRTGREGVKHFELFRFRAKNSQLVDSGESGRIYTPRPQQKKRGKNDFIVTKRLQRDAARKAKQRDRETSEQHKARVEQQRIRQAQLRQRRYNEE